MSPGKVNSHSASSWVVFSVFASGTIDLGFLEVVSQLYKTGEVCRTGGERGWDGLLRKASCRACRFSSFVRASEGLDDGFSCGADVSGLPFVAAAAAFAANRGRFVGLPILPRTRISELSG
jgi:hypothetical protein